MLVDLDKKLIIYANGKKLPFDNKFKYKIMEMIASLNWNPKEFRRMVKRLKKEE